MHISETQHFAVPDAIGEVASISTRRDLFVRATQCEVVSGSSDDDRKIRLLLAEDTRILRETHAAVLYAWRVDARSRAPADRLLHQHRSTNVRPYLSGTREEEMHRLLREGFDQLAPDAECNGLSNWTDVHQLVGVDGALETFDLTVSDIQSERADGLCLLFPSDRGETGTSAARENHPSRWSHSTRPP